METPATAKRIALAAVAGAHGIKGEVRLKLFGSIEGLAAQTKVFVGDREVTLKAAKAAGKGAIASLEGVADRSAAEALRGQLIEIDRASLLGMRVRRLAGKTPNGFRPGDPASIIA